MRNPVRAIYVALIAMILFITGCSPRLVPLPAPTQIPVDINATANALRTQVAATIASQTTQTAAALPTQSPPSATPAPTETPPVLATLPPLETATPTLQVALPSITAIPTVIFFPTNTLVPIRLATSTPIQTDYQCMASAQSIPWGMKIRAGVDFDSRWTVINTGSKDWNAGDITYEFVTGAEVHTKSHYTLNKGVDTNDKADIIVDMIAPKETGIYQSTWAVYRGNKTLCTLELTFYSVTP